MTAVTERVAAGAAYLDEHDPDWWRADVERAIDLDRLRMNRPDACILGQRCPVDALAKYTKERFGLAAADVPDAEDFRFWALASALSGIGAGTESDDEELSPVVAWSSALGFNSPNSDPLEFGKLTAEWRRVIEARRAS